MFFINNMSSINKKQTASNLRELQNFIYIESRKLNIGSRIFEKDVLHYNIKFLNEHNHNINVREVVLLNYFSSKIKFHEIKGDLQLEGYRHTYSEIENDLGGCIDRSTIFRIIKKFVSLGIIAKTTEAGDNIFSKPSLFFKFVDADLLNELFVESNSKDIGYFDKWVAKRAGITAAIIYQKFPYMTNDHPYVQINLRYLASTTGLTYKEVRSGLANLMKFCLIKKITDNPEFKGYYSRI